MECDYTAEQQDIDRERSSILMASLPDDSKWIAAELMEISFRSGVAAGKARANNAALLLA